MPRAVVLALILLFSVPTAAVAPAGMPSSDAAQADLLTLETTQKSAIVTPSLDVSAAVAMQTRRSEAAIRRHALTRRLERTSEATPESLLLTALLATRDRAVDLRERERDLRAAFVNDSIDSQTFISGLAAVNARSAVLRETLATIQAHAGELEGVTFQQRSSTIENDLLEFSGPVRGRALGAIRGSAAPNRLYVAASQRGVVLSMVEDGGYVREAYRVDRRSGELEQVSPDEFGELIEVYPDAFNESFRQRLDSSGNGIYTIRYFYRDGYVDAYVHGGQRTVFYEIRDRQVSAVLSAQTASAAANGTELVITRSYPGGPVRITTADTATGEAVAATVLFGEYRLETGPDGLAYAVMPDQARVSVTAIRPQGNVSTFVRPLERASDGSSG